MLGVYFRTISTFLLIIVLVWHFSPSVLTFFYSTTNKYYRRTDFRETPCRTTENCVLIPFFESSFSSSLLVFLVQFDSHWVWQKTFRMCCHNFQKVVTICHNMDLDVTTWSWRREHRLSFRSHPNPVYSLSSVKHSSHWSLYTKLSFCFGGSSHGRVTTPKKWFSSGELASFLVFTLSCDGWERHTHIHRGYWFSGLTSTWWTRRVR